MARTTRGATIALLLAFAAPLAQAATNVQGDAAALDAPRVDGPGEASAAMGILDLTAAAQAGALRIAWSSASGHRTTGWQVGAAGNGWGPDSDRAPIAWPAGNLSEFACARDCTVVLSLLPDGQGAIETGALGLAGPLAGAPALASVHRYAALGPPGSPLVDVGQDASWLSADTTPGASGLGIAGGTPFAHGRVALRIWNASALRQDAAGAERVESGERVEPVVDVLGIAAAQNTTWTILTLTLEDARVEAPSGGALLLAPALDLRVHGEASWRQAWGEVRVGGRATPVRGESLHVVGPALRLGLALPAAPTAASRGALSGEASSVRVAGRELVPADAPVSPGQAEVVAGVLVAASLVALLARLGAWAALYSRVTRSRLLANPTRVAAYERILAQPGVHVAQLSRDVGVGRVVLQHHLRLLEAHGLVAARALGRVRAYYPGGRAPGAEGVRHDVALKDATRSAILALLAGAPQGLTQKEVAQRAGLSQRLVSYHLARLGELGMIEGRGERPRRFAPAGCSPSGPTPP
ncbi:MAG: hypothetical protein QOE90_1108 [Thermoplasmata archaeon]|nr:hypothetical protein [Thermoplasmata archaeon]